jgi:hypothetical protein
MTAAEGRAMWQACVEDLWSALFDQDEQTLMDAARRLYDCEIYLLCEAGVSFPTAALAPAVARFREQILACVEV